MTDTQPLKDVAQQMRLRSHQFTEHSQNLDEVTRTLDSQVDNLVNGLLGWQGLASTRFTEIWESYRTSAQQAATALNETVQTLQNLAGQIDIQADLIEIAEAVQTALLVVAGIEVGAALIEGGLNLLADAAAAEATGEEMAAKVAVDAAKAALEDIDRNGGIGISVIETGPGATSSPDLVSVPIEEQSAVERELGQTSGTWLDGKVPYQGNITGKAFQDEAGVTGGPSGLGIKKELDLGSLQIKGRIGNERLGLWGALKPQVLSLESQGNFGSSSLGDLNFSPLKLQVRAGVNVAGYSVGVNTDLGPSLLVGLPSKPGEKPDIKTPFLTAGFITGLA